jgi:C-terminal processing protease CtpA/Prc
MSSMVINRIDEDTPASRARLKVGDQIVEYGGARIPGALADQVTAIHNALKPGDVLKLKVVDATGAERAVELVGLEQP